MMNNPTFPLKSVSYFFSRSKDVNEENGSLIITLFGRLSREWTWSDEFNTYSKTETVWVDIEDVQMEQATDKIISLPNQICRYEITEQIFRDLFHVSRNNPSELYSVTPIHIDKEIEVPAVIT